VFSLTSGSQEEDKLSISLISGDNLSLLSIYLSLISGTRAIE
jgi:hypothetical protein